MISVASGDCGLDTTPPDTAIEENLVEDGVSGGGGGGDGYGYDEGNPRVSGLELESDEGKDSVLVDENGGSEGEEEEEVKDRVRVPGESDADKEMDEYSDEIDPEDYGSDESMDGQGGSVGSGAGARVEDYSSLMSEFDDFVANEKKEDIVAVSRALSYGFEVGDMVWGKVKSHPWWPGHLFNEAFASSSVRRTRRAGHVLVAFFGDSSYGWFDPAELIPFNANFAEKCQQTNSRNFVKAVEEAVDEASRRSALGLACRCRNRGSFRSTNMEGYFSVDVPDYEAGGLYSVRQIKKARDEFQPVDTLAFVKHLASAPQDFDESNIDFIKKRATVFAYRKAVFEEFDETYAQAFGVQAKRPLDETANASNHPVKEPTRAPLSGPLVIAETLGGGKSPKKSMKVKDQSKKDKYLFKRREELSDLKTFPVGQIQATSMEGSPAVAAGDYVLQKRAQANYTSVKQEQTDSVSRDGAASGEHDSGQGGAVLNQAAGCVGLQAPGGAALDSKPSLDAVRSSLSGKAMRTGAAEGISASLKQDSEPVSDLRYEESVKASRSTEGSPPSELTHFTRAEGDKELDRFDGHPGSHSSAQDARHLVGVTTDGGVKKAKAAVTDGVKKAKSLKRPMGELSSENPIVEEKKKKRKKELGAETAPDRSKKSLTSGKGGTALGNSTGKHQSSLASKEDPRVSHQKKDVGTIHSLSSYLSTLPGEVVLPQLLGDLHALALDPFYGSERNSPTIAKWFFLQFRSLVYQKSLALSSPSETEHVEARSSKSPLGAASDKSAGEDVRDGKPPKPAKSMVRPDDPTKAGRKRLPSDRQEDIAAKRLKKINQLKSLAQEKKVGQKSSESHREQKEPVPSPPPPKAVKPDYVKKMLPTSRVVEPTILDMKFPPKTSLPSASALKLKFARFGSIDHSAIRVYWESSTCRVVFRHRADGQAAYRYATANNLFGNAKVRYTLKTKGASAPEEPESDKMRGDGAFSEALRIKDPMNDRPASSYAHQPLPQSTVQPKSILKKPTNDEAGQVAGGANGGKGTTRVKFMLGGEESSRGEQLMVGNRNNFNNASFPDGGAPTSVAMEFNSKNFQKGILPSPSPIHPVPTQYAKAPSNNSHHSEVAPRNMHNFSTSNAAPSTQSIDISQQMLSLLTRCNDVVSTLTGWLGYVPYHPL